ncbi:uncharacterized protein LOC115449186 [Manduca sexta]|uniref:Single domain-containing protein n=1 Tax=Manduca sexta TaxID=7130 RepID=A0A922CUN1_MANSE|nr:uncharacterized protein LOC115449186 [Manduca sexta]KAG6458992.1 hypothetical protein O3G_MSEX011150 [Manduca sexta]KAG6458993.1 hypothetical protein O3G_MSEX011150 [Manduca sexta]
MVSRILVVALVVCTANAATWMGYLPEKPKELAHKEGCYIEEINDVVPFGTEVKPIGRCVRINCGNPMMHYASCGVVGTTSDNCYVTKEDLSKPYPECCPDIKCDFENNV